jgi:hypothetical protein
VLTASSAWRPRRLPSPLPLTWPAETEPSCAWDSQPVSSLTYLFDVFRKHHNVATVSCHVPLCFPSYSPIIVKIFSFLPSIRHFRRAHFRRGAQGPDHQRIHRRWVALDVVLCCTMVILMLFTEARVNCWLVSFLLRLVIHILFETHPVVSTIIVKRTSTSIKIIIFLLLFSQVPAPMPPRLLTSPREAWWNATWRPPN